MSTTDAYRATEDTDFVAPTSEHALGDDPEAMRTIEKHRGRKDTHKGNQHPGDEGAAGSMGSASPDERRAIYPAVDKPIPMRVPARDMRVWFAPWQDASGILHLGGYAIVELEGPRWIWGDSLKTIEPARFFSLQESPSEPKGPVGNDQRASSVRSGTSERAKPTSPSFLSNQGAPR